MNYYATVGDHTYQIEIIDNKNILVDGEPHTVDWLSLNQGTTSFSLIVDTRSHEVVAESADSSRWSILMSGEKNEVEVMDELQWRIKQTTEASGGSAGIITIKSPMPGVILRVPLAIGTVVSKGDTVIILESMKMENELKSPKDGVIDAIHIEQGATVEKNQSLITIGDEPDVS